MVKSFKLVFCVFLVSLFGAGCSSGESDSSGDGGVPLAYVTNQKGNITVLDLESLEVVGEIDVEGKGPRGVGITPDGKTIVVANVDGGDISLIDRESGAIKKHIQMNHTKNL